MYMLAIILEFAIDVLFGAAFLWLAMKFTARVIAGMQAGAVYCSWSQILMASTAAAVAALVPPSWVGWVLSWIVLFVLLKRFTGGSFGEVLLIVVISRVAAVVASTFLFAGMLVS